MKIVVALDSFKGSAPSYALNAAVKKGIKSVLPQTEVCTFEIADGGEGTLTALAQKLGGERIKVATVDLMGRQITASYLLAGDVAVVEAAQVIGLDKITPTADTFTQASSRGLAALFIDAEKRGVRELLVSLGGTGTSDGGLGLLEGLGGSIFALPLFENMKVTALTDVTNVYAGENGYARVFGPQKGGTPDLIEQQEAQAQERARQIRERYGLDVQKVAGTGAAGGLGAAILLLGGELKSGFFKIAELLELEEELKDADLVITGEGSLDFQTAHGKVPYGMAILAKKHKVPTLAFVGTLGENLGEMEELLLASFSIQPRPLSLEQALEEKGTLHHLEELTKNVIKARFL